MALGRGLAIWGLVTLGSAGALQAQEPTLPNVGSRVRIHSPRLTAGTLVGTLTAIDQRSLTIDGAGGDQPMTLALSDVSRLEKSVRRSQRKKGALLGLGVGFAVGIAATATKDGGKDSDSGLVWGLINGAVTAAVGAVIGAAVAPGERWAEVAVSQIRVGDDHAQRAARSRITIRPLVGRQYGILLEASLASSKLIDESHPSSCARAPQGTLKRSRFEPLPGDYRSAYLSGMSLANCKE